jgi:hypothetical protein
MLLLSEGLLLPRTNAMPHMEEGLSWQAKAVPIFSIGKKRVHVASAVKNSAFFFLNRLENANLSWRDKTEEANRKQSSGQVQRT